MALNPQITVVVPSYNQGAYLEAALTSIFSQEVPVEVFVMDGGSTDNSLDVIHRWEHRLAGWRSHADAGQSAAINEGITRGGAPYVCWLNSDDYYLPGGLVSLLARLEMSAAPAAYGRAWNIAQASGEKYPVWVEPFSETRLAMRCIVSQPATLMRRHAWEAVGGLDEHLQMVMDYDLWWRLFKHAGPLLFVDDYVAVNREHEETKTNTRRKLHYAEAFALLNRHHGRIPLKWRLSKLIDR